MSEQHNTPPVNITRLPGVNCRHYLEGRCLLEERRNPGLHVEWQCKILQGWESAYDRFLAQAENFQLEIELATRIWAQRLGGMLQKPSPCLRYEPVVEEPVPTRENPDDASSEEGEQKAETEDVLCCVHSWVGLCLLEMPECTGLCNHYERD